MRILHTSDWHLGRTFHGRVLDEAHAVIADHLVELAGAEDVDAVVISGDVYDRAIPPTDSVRLLDETLARLSSRTRVVLTPGNHDSALRLGFGSRLYRPSLAVRTRVDEVDRPLVLPGPDGADGLYIYALPYLDPDAARQSLPPLLAERLAEETARPAAGRAHEADAVPGRPVLPRSHEAVMSGALRLVGADLRTRRSGGARRVPALVMAHAFVVGGLASQDSERDIRVGGVDSVPAEVFTGLGSPAGAEDSGGLDYVALGHLHRPQEIRPPAASGAPPGGRGGCGPRLVYSGSPLALSFPEADHPKSTVIVEIGPQGVSSFERIPAPVPERIITVTGTMEQLLSPAWEHAVGAWVRAVVRGPLPLGAPALLRRRFGQVLAIVREEDGAAPRERITVTRAADPLEVSTEFLTAVGRGAPTPAQTAALTEAYEAVLAGRVSA